VVAAYAAQQQRACWRSRLAKLHGMVAACRYLPFGKWLHGCRSCVFLSLLVPCSLGDCADKFLMLLLQVSSFSYDGVTVYIREGALGDGLGAKVWSVCHIMCR
jgi:hypothetical protein